jgi:glutathione S-transferase
MKLRYGAASPFARKCALASHVLGLADRVTLVDNTTDPDDAIRSRNPLNKIPMLLIDDGMAIFDSPVILEYLDHVAGGGKILPTEPKARFRALIQQALADVLMDAAILVMYEGRFREPSQHSPKWVAMQQGKVDKALQALEADLPGDEVTVGTITIACALGYLDFRFNGEWRKAHAKLAAWQDGFRARVPGYDKTQPVA